MMSLTTLRNLVYNSLLADPALIALDVSADNLHPNYSRDSPPVVTEGRRFLVLRWNNSEPGMGRATPHLVALWAYDRDPDYSWISDVLYAARSTMGALLSQSHAPDGWVIGGEWLGGSPDLNDDVYKAYTRNEEWRLVATGT
jgi:hypothetical protein